MLDSAKEFMLLLFYNGEFTFLKADLKVRLEYNFQILKSKNVSMTGFHMQKKKAKPSWNSFICLTRQLKTAVSPELKTQKRSTI